MENTRPANIRELLLSIIEGRQPQKLFQGEILEALQQQLRKDRKSYPDEEILTEWYDLFRTGYISWGYNLINTDHPWCHVTNRGKRALERIGRDPGNPAGYLRHVHSSGSLPPITDSYLKEGLECYSAGYFKAAAVMIGIASENLILELRDAVVNRLKFLNQKEPRNITDWRIKIILEVLQAFFDARKKDFTKEMREQYESYWAAFAHQIRIARNDAGHPSSIDAVTEDSVHASFLVFPTLAWLCKNLSNWVNNDMQ